MCCCDADVCLFTHTSTPTNCTFKPFNAEVFGSVPFSCCCLLTDFSMATCWKSIRSSSRIWARAAGSWRSAPLTLWPAWRRQPRLWATRRERSWPWPLSSSSAASLPSSSSWWPTNSEQFCLDNNQCFFSRLIIFNLLSKVMRGIYFNYVDHYYGRYWAGVFTFTNLSLECVVCQQRLASVCVCVCARHFLPLVICFCQTVSTLCWANLPAHAPCKQIN